jgi:hypothetical protein
VFVSLLLGAGKTCLIKNRRAIAHWAHALVAFVNSKHAVRHRLIVVGHSTGASAWLVRQASSTGMALLTPLQDVLHEVLPFPDTIHGNYISGTCAI